MKESLAIIGKYVRFFFLLIPWIWSFRWHSFRGTYDEPNPGLGRLEGVREGDLIFIRRFFPAPWGYWGHCGLVIGPDLVISAENHKGVILTDLDRFYKSDEIMFVRPQYRDAQTVQEVIASARRFLGVPFSFLSNIPKDDHPRNVSCVTFLSYILSRYAGIEIDYHGFATPDDLSAIGNAVVVSHQSVREDVVISQA